MLCRDVVSLFVFTYPSYPILSNFGTVTCARSKSVHDILVSHGLEDREGKVWSELAAGAVTLWGFGEDPARLAGAADSIADDAG